MIALTKHCPIISLELILLAALAGLLRVVHTLLSKLPHLVLIIVTIGSVLIVILEVFSVEALRLFVVFKFVVGFLKVRYEVAARRRGGLGPERFLFSFYLLSFKTNGGRKHFKHPLN